MLEDAITLLPQTKLRKLITQYLNPAELRPYGGRKENLLADVKAFQKASLAGKYYQAFAVNSKNYTEKSSGTLAWIAVAVGFLSGAWLSRRKGVRRRYAKPSRLSLVCLARPMNVPMTSCSLLTKAAHGKPERTGRTCCRPGSASFPRRSVPPSTRRGLRRSSNVTTSTGA